MKKIDVSEIAEKLKSENPEAFGKMNEKRVAFMIRSVFGEIKEVIEKNEDETVHVRGLGRFKIGEVEFEKDGKKISKKRIIFTPIKSKN